jgi:uncharacterized protein YcfL
MKKLWFLAAAVVLLMSNGCTAADGDLMLDDFEIAVAGGPEGTVDFGAGNGSAVQVSGSSDIKNSGNQALKVDYEAIDGGYIYIARGFGLDAKNTNWDIKPSDIKWEEYSAISFYLYGTDSKANIAFDVKDAGGEIWRFAIVDDFVGWKKVVCAFDQFIVRDDWQPQDADQNGMLDYPIKIFQFEPLPGTKGTLYFDTVELIKK